MSENVIIQDIQETQKTENSNESTYNSKELTKDIPIVEEQKLKFKCRICYSEFEEESQAFKCEQSHPYYCRICFTEYDSEKVRAFCEQKHQQNLNKHIMQGTSIINID